MKQSITNEQVLDAVYDLADICGMRIDEFVTHLQEEYGDPEFDTEGLPEEVVEELQNAKALRKESRAAKRKKDKETALQSEIEAFHVQFPEVKADDIPADVWDDVSSGTDLLHAYALWYLTDRHKDDHAEEVNKETAFRSASVKNGGSTEPSFSREEVEKMSPKEVSKNFKNILHSMKNWKY